MITSVKKLDNKDKIISIRLNNKEQKKFECMRILGNFDNNSELIKSMVLDEKSVSTFTQSFEKIEGDFSKLISLVYELNKIGININQISTVLNRKSLIDKNISIDDLKNILYVLQNFSEINNNQIMPILIKIKQKFLNIN